MTSGPGDDLVVESPDERPGVPDAFQRLWTPHRMVYIGGENKPSDATQGSARSAGSRRGRTMRV